VQGNGIGPLVSQFVHERNALRASGGEKAVKPHPHSDTVEFSASALARFEALKAKLGGGLEPQPDPDPIDGVDPDDNAVGFVPGDSAAGTVPDDDVPGDDPPSTQTFDGTSLATSFERVRFSVYA